MRYSKQVHGDFSHISATRLELASDSCLIWKSRGQLGAVRGSCVACSFPSTQLITTSPPHSLYHTYIPYLHLLHRHRSLPAAKLLRVACHRPGRRRGALRNERVPHAYCTQARPVISCDESSSCSTCTTATSRAVALWTRAHDAGLAPWRRSRRSAAVLVAGVRFAVHLRDFSRGWPEEASTSRPQDGGQLRAARRVTFDKSQLQRQQPHPLLPNERAGQASL